MCGSGQTKGQWSGGFESVVCVITGTYSHNNIMTYTMDVCMNLSCFCQLIRCMGFSGLCLDTDTIDLRYFSQTYRYTNSVYNYNKIIIIVGLLYAITRAIYGYVILSKYVIGST